MSEFVPRWVPLDSMKPVEPYDFQVKVVREPGSRLGLLGTLVSLWSPFNPENWCDTYIIYIIYIHSIHIIYILYTYYIHIMYILYTIYIHICVYITIYRYTHISSVPFHMVNYLWDLVSLLLWPLRTWISFEVKNLTFQMMWQESWSWRWTSPGQNSLWSLVCQAFFYLAVQSVQVPDTELGFSMFLGFSDPVENKDFEKHSCTRVSSPLNMVWLQWNRREFAQFCLQRSNRYYQHGMTGVASATRVLWLQSVAAVL